jgi:hypothetical protein
MKKVSFTGKPNIGAGGNRPDPDSWVQNREVESSETKEAMKRLTIDVPVSLHKRIKSQCAMQDLVMADVIRDLLDQRFPAPEGQGAAS